MSGDRPVDLFEDLGEGFDHVICATYNISPDFLEGFLLRHVGAFADAERVTILVDARQARAAYASLRATQVNRRYVLHPIHAGAGAFHTKFVVAIGESRAAALVGSANLTEGGWMRNLELVDLFGATPDVPDDEGVVVGLLAYVERLLRAHPSTAVSRSLSEARATAPWLKHVETAGISALLTTATSLLDQIGDRVAALGDPVEMVDLLAPYHDPTHGFLDAVVERLHPRAIRLFVAEEHGFARGLAAWARRNRVDLTCSVAEPKEESRFLHAKALSIRTRAREWHAFGSANATSAAMLGGTGGNEEVLVLRHGKARSHSAVEVLLRRVAVTREIDPEETPPIVVTVDVPDPVFPVRLLEAERNGAHVRAGFEADELPVAVYASLRSVDGERETVPLRRRDGEWRTLELTNPSLLFRHAVRLTLVDADGRALSNDVFVLDLVERRDASTAVRRAVAKANATALGVDLALAMLRDLGDERALIDFFWFVNVPGVPSAGAHFMARRANDLKPYTPKAPLDLHAQLDLDQALAAFWRRHLRRLEVVVDAPTPETVPTAVHLIAALHAGLEVQTAELLARVRRDPTMTVDEWKDARTLMDRALLRYDDLASAIAQLGDHRSPQVAVALRSHGAELRRGYDLVLRWRAEFETARAALRVQYMGRPTVPAEYFEGNVALRWPTYTSRLAETVGSMLARVAA